MPKYRFSWDAFSDATVAALAIGWGYEGPAPGARAWLEQSVKRPNDDFVRHLKHVIEETWLVEYPGTRQLVERLIEADIGPLNNPRSQSGYVRYVKKCRNAGTLRQLLLEAMLRYGDRDREDGEPAEIEGVTVPRFATLVPVEQQEDRRRPYQHQLDAWNRLSTALSNAEATGDFQGLLVMPTGSGKSFTAVNWLLRNAVDRGFRVLWLAHRYELLEQAAAEFHRQSGVLRQVERVRVRIVSGRHCSTAQIDPADHVIVAMIASVARRRDVIDPLLEDAKTFLVIDEAHHAPAKSYRDVIRTLQEGRQRHVLGLTATPTRTDDREKPLLSALFGGRVFYQIEVRDLIERKLLARPIPIRVATGADAEAGVTADDIRHLDQFNELSEGWRDRIASLTPRNDLIVRQFVDNRVRYGKTLVFAINVHHAALLAQQFRDAGIRADYVASYRPDQSDVDNKTLVEAFRSNDLDVLINVQILTEGVDIPDVQTVFLTRPTSSEILMRQMIGRALRGPSAGGTTEAYLVSFEDHWERFREWQSPLDLVPDIATPVDLPDRTGTARRMLELLPWDLIVSTSRAIRQKGIAYAADAFEALPHGWFVLSRFEEEEEIRQIIPVFDHQLPWWQKLLEHLGSMDTEARATYSAGDAYDEWFVDCDPPWASAHDLGRMIAHFRATAESPEYHALDERRLADPHEIAREVWDRDLGPRAKAELVDARYGSLARAIYPTVREFRAAIDDALYEIQNPQESTCIPKAVPIFAPRPEDQLRPPPDGGHAHDLPVLMAEVLEAGRALLELPTLPHVGELRFTRRLIKNWYGMAHWEHHQAPGTGVIRINRLLDSPDVSVATIRYLLWHEYLHLFLQQGHTKEFYDRERRWPGYVDADRELQNLNERFGIQYW